MSTKKRGPSTLIMTWDWRDIRSHFGGKMSRRKQFLIMNRPTLGQSYLMDTNSQTQFNAAKIPSQLSIPQRGWYTQPIPTIIKNTTNLVTHTKVNGFGERHWVGHILWLWSGCWHHPRSGRQISEAHGVPQGIQSIHKISYACVCYYVRTCLVICSYMCIFHVM